MDDDLKVFTVEYRLTGGARFDASTDAPAFSIDPRDPDFVEPGEDQIVRFDLTQNVGIIDPDFNGTDGTEGDRFITLLDIQLPEPGTLAVGVGVRGDFENGGAPQQLAVEANGERAYTCGCIFVPQGSLLFIFTDVVSNEEYFLRYSVLAAESQEMLARYIETCCCNERTFPVQVCDPPRIASVDSNETQQDPAYLNPNSESENLQVRGSGFTPSDQFEILGPDPVPVVTGTNFFDPTLIEIFVETGELVLGSVWSLRACREDDSTCCGELPDSLEAPTCLRYTDTSPSAIPQNSGNIPVRIRGYGFDNVGPVTLEILQGGTDIFVPGSLSVVANDAIDFQVDTNGAPLGFYQAVITPDPASGCPTLTVDDVLSIIL
jgi:hypothetical protein